MTMTMMVIFYDSNELSLNLNQYGYGMTFRFEAALIVSLFLKEKEKILGLIFRTNLFIHST